MVADQAPQVVQCPDGLLKTTYLKTRPEWFLNRPFKRVYFLTSFSLKKVMERSQAWSWARACGWIWPPYLGRDIFLVDTFHFSAKLEFNTFFTPSCLFIVKYPLLWPSINNYLENSSKCSLPTSQMRWQKRVSESRNTLKEVIWKCVMKFVTFAQFAIVVVVHYFAELHTGQLGRSIKWPVLSNSTWTTGRRNISNQMKIGRFQNTSIA